MAISIIKDANAIVALIGSIGTKQGDYRNSVSSAVLSTVAHSIEHGETTLVNKLLSEVFTNAYRDLKVVVKFIQSNTPIVLEEVKEGRRSKAVVAACQFEKNNFDKTGKTQKEASELSVKALKRNNSREAVFATFCDPNGEMQVRNLEWHKGDDSDKRTVGVKYACNIFSWYEDVEYIRKQVEDGKDADAVNPFDALSKDAYENAQNPVVAAIKALETLTGEDRTNQVVEDLKALQAIATRIADHVKQREAQRAEAVDVKTLEKAGATAGQIKKWLELRAKRVAEGKELEAIEAEFKQAVISIKEKAAKAETKAEEKAAA